MAKSLFITGTGTDVGKTYISALILKKISEKASGGYFKAAMSGNIEDKNGSLIPGDAVFVKEFSKIKQELVTMCPYIYKNAYSPHLASKIEGNPIEMGKIIESFNYAKKSCDYLTMEGSGGILCPIFYDNSENPNEKKNIMLEDIIKELNLSCVIVADAGLGTINSVVLTYKYMNSKNLKVKALIFNNYHGGILEDDNIFMCEKLTGLKTLAKVRPNAKTLDCSFEELTKLYE